MLLPLQQGKTGFSLCDHVCEHPKDPADSLIALQRKFTNNLEGPSSCFRGTVFSKGCLLALRSCLSACASGSLFILRMCSSQNSPGGATTAGDCQRKRCHVFLQLTLELLNGGTLENISGTGCSPLIRT
uniref:Uncharacterized protein n=1 Tax=Cyanistes caeruleus TaxID=156563 RepID=A0A8C0VTU2_CYACU